MILKCIPVGPHATNCYVFACPETKEAMIVDPGAEPDKILAFIEKKGVRVTHIVVTHGHWDHIEALEPLRQSTGAKVCIHSNDADGLINPKINHSAFSAPCPVQCMLADVLLEDGDEIKVGTLTFKVLHTPGHSPGGICLSFPGGVITGDTLFAGSVGRTGFGGSEDALMNSIKQKLLSLDPDAIIYPGHGPTSFIADEKLCNPFIS